MSATTSKIPSFEPRQRLRLLYHSLLDHVYCRRPICVNCQRIHRISLTTIFTFDLLSNQLQDLASLIPSLRQPYFRHFVMKLPLHARHLCFQTPYGLSPILSTSTVFTLFWSHVLPSTLFWTLMDTPSHWNVELSTKLGWDLGFYSVCGRSYRFRVPCCTVT
ncbi:hypothetical protein BDN72DRAFT_622744 [Pluteus cervinus]|uniref:Uncharacterized protein n=1 Tax=Pluteus cervinus TaxID=181527 RepID=A0ACD3A0S3_9AGAR|nr:hypothetical protein BDN72DRAFT_622744 [Pluteus cervinus]